MKIIYRWFLWYCRDVGVDTVKTGLKGKAGNKGGIGIRFQLFSNSFCFVCSHLAAGQNHVDDRNSDFKDIHEGLVFPMVCIFSLFPFWILKEILKLMIYM